MSQVRYKRMLLDLARLRRRQLMRPLRHRLRVKALWSFEREATAKAAAIGVFFAIAMPIAQVIFALVAAVLLRANIVVAAASTLISNPVTLPIIYYWAYRTGAFLLGATAADTPADAVEGAEEAAEYALEVTHWFPALIEWIPSVGPGLALGVAIFSLSAALIAYGTVQVVYKVWAVVASRRARTRAS